MKAILSILLAISLAFNVFFAVGYFQACKEAEIAQTLEGRAKMMAQKLNLDVQQYKVFEGLLAEFVQLREAKNAQRDAFLSELLKDEPDEKVLENFCAGDSAKQHRLAGLALMRKFIGILHPHQRELFVEIMKKRDFSRQPKPTQPGK